MQAASEFALQKLSAKKKLNRAAVIYITAHLTKAYLLCQQCKITAEDQHPSGGNPDG
jgi:hypothetical protein